MTSQPTVRHAIGVPTPRIDGVDKTTGRAAYTADVQLDGMLWGRTLRSPHRHARIVRIDTTRAREAPGVHAVVTAADTFPNARYGRSVIDVPVIAADVVRFVGEPVAAVAAVDEDAADAALRLVDVEYEELPSVHDPAEAMLPGAPVLHPNMLDYQGLPQPLEKPMNNYGTFEWTQGDVEEGLRTADVVVESTFTTQRQHHGYMEPHSCVVQVDESGRVNVWAPNKSPHSAVRFLSIASGLPADRILLRPITIGGDFGGKGSIMHIPIATMLALATGHPIRMVMDYTEELIAGNPRHASVTHMRTGVTRDGTIVAHDAEIIFDSGAYAGYKPQGHLGGASSAAGPYRAPHGRVVERQVYTNNVPCGYMRGPGEPQAMFAVESQMDCVARAIGMNPVELRRKNLIREGDANAIGASFQAVRAVETLDRAVAASGFYDPKPSDGRTKIGRGIAIGDRSQAGGETHAAVTLRADGSVVVHTSVFEQGTGSYTVMQQLAADGFGVPVDRVSVQVWNTDEADNDSGIGGARVTRMASAAVYDAIENTRAALVETAAEALGVAPELLTVQGDRVLRSDTEESEEWASVVARAGHDVTSLGETKDSSRNPFTSFTAQVAEVSVDSETGEVRLLKVTTVHDTGTVLNPIGHEGQINGGLMQGIGYGLWEELVVDDGQVTTTSFADYKMPSIADVPELRTVLLDPAPGMGPYQIKGIGEHSTSQIAPAIANAVEDASGLRVRDLPVTAEKVYRGLSA